jgi:hypothetical protein
MVLLVMVLSSPANAEARARMKAAKKNANRVLGEAIVCVGLVFVAFWLLLLLLPDRLCKL